MGDENPTERLDEKNGTIVFVLGAGCSADCGAPTMQDFMRKAREYERALKADDPRKKDYEALFTFREDCLKVSYVFDRWWENIEHLFTQAHLRKLIGGKGADELCERITRAIWDVYRRPNRQPHANPAYGDFRDYLCRVTRRYPEAPRPVVVTTNYDIHLETAILRVLHVAGPGGRSQTTGLVCYAANPCLDDNPKRGFWSEQHLAQLLGAGQTILRSQSDLRAEPLEIWPLEVVKLHGSVNWFIDRSKDAARCDSDMRAQWRAGRWGGHTPGFVCQGDEFVISGGEGPLVVPPLLGKADLPRLIAAQWRRAVQAIQWARLVVVIGYSFPETDTFMSRLLAEGIRSNRGLERFIIINPEVDKDQWKARVERMFARSWWDFSVDRVAAFFADAAAGMSQDTWPRKLLMRGPSEPERLLRDLAGLESPRK